ncbi:MAG: hypothetical protein ABI779_11655 [Acidobacteriota bacterium]
MSRELDVWHLTHLSRSLAYAGTESAWYARRWAAERIAPRDLRTAPDLEGFPLTYKRELQDSGEDFRVRSVPATSFRSTSGTTARRLMLYGRREEGVAATRLHEQLRGRSKQPFLHMRLIPAMRRTLESDGGGSNSTLLFTYAAHDNPGKWFDGAEHFVETLWQEYALWGRSVRISAIHVTPPPLLAYVTERMLERGIDPAGSGVQVIAHSGGPVFERHRRIVTEHWRARSTSSYSCTEINGWCEECPTQAGVYHDALTSWLEIVGDDQRAVGHGECGSVLLTSYTPFQEVTPLVRYWTGDVAERLDKSCSCRSARLSFRIVGRTQHCVDLTPLVGTRTFLGPLHVGDAVSGLAAIPQHLYPHFRLERSEGPRGAVIRLLLESSLPESIPARELGTAIRKRLLSARESFAPLKRPGALEVVLHQRGGVEGAYSLYPDR